MTIHEYSQVTLLFATGFLIYLVKTSLPAYLTEKGKNLATKEDLRQITKTVEDVKLQFSQAGLVHKVQFEAEFESYQALWSSAQAAVVAHARLSINAPDNSKIDTFGSSQIDFSNSVTRHEPFIPESVFLSFKALDDLFVGVKIDLLTGHHEMNPNRTDDRKAISESARQAAEAIKQRLAAVLVV